MIAGSQTYWTTGVEEGILKNALHEFFDVLLENVCLEYINHSSSTFELAAGCLEEFGEGKLVVFKTRGLIGPDCHRGPCS